jgi:hypothetical protein
VIAFGYIDDERGAETLAELKAFGTAACFVHCDVSSAAEVEGLRPCLIQNNRAGMGKWRCRWGTRLCSPKRSCQP